jgi:hypothetical protein
MKKISGFSFACLALLLLSSGNGAAQILPADGAGVEVTVPIDVELGPILSIPPPLPVPVLPGTKVHFKLNGLSVIVPTEFAWTRNGVLVGSSRDLEIVFAGINDTGQYIATVTTRQGDVITGSRVLHVAEFPRQRLMNMSTRARVSAGRPPVIAGFVVDAGPGDALSSKLLLIRAVGPSLETFGVRDALPDPTLELFRADGSRIEVSPTLRDPARLAGAAVRTGASPLRPGTADTGLLISLRGGVYTAHVSSASDQSGEVLVEIYEVPR